jgi:hypothetical protein
MADGKIHESDVLRLMLGRRENYGVSSLSHRKGRLYSIVMNEQHYNGVVLVSSFEYYQKRYHITRSPPDLVVCFSHNTVLPCACLSLAKGNFARPYDLPESITDVERQRFGKTGSQVLLGMYISGMRVAQDILFAENFPPTTRRRYLQKARELGKRSRGRPVGERKEQAASS